MSLFFFFLMIRRPPRSTLFPTRRSSDLDPDGVRPADSGRGARGDLVLLGRDAPRGRRHRLELGDQDRKSTRLNSSHTVISYAVFCLKKKKKKTRTTKTH